MINCLKIKQKSKIRPFSAKKGRFYAKTAKNNPSDFENSKKEGGIFQKLCLTIFD